MEGHKGLTQPQQPWDSLQGWDAVKPWHLALLTTHFSGGEGDVGVILRLQSPFQEELSEAGYITENLEVLGPNKPFPCPY